MAKQAVNKRLFEVEVDGEKVELAAVMPTSDLKTKGDLAYGRAFREAVEAGLLVRAKLSKYMTDMGLWDESKQEEYTKVVKRIWSNELKIKQGGNAALTKLKARDLAIEMRRDRLTLSLLSVDRNNLDLTTAESFADNAKFDALVAGSVVYAKDGKPYFSCLKDYKEREGEADREKAALEFSKLYYNVVEDREKSYPENELLLRLGYVNESLHLINKDGHLIDADGKLVNADGRFVNDKDELIDDEGNVIDESGNYVTDFAEFLPEPGEREPVAPEKPEPEEPFTAPVEVGEGEAL